MGTDAEKTLKDLEDLYRDWFAAITNRDLSFFERTLGPDCSTSTSQAGVVTRLRTSATSEISRRAFSSTTRRSAFACSSHSCSFTAATRSNVQSKVCRRVRRRASRPSGNAPTGHGKRWRTTPRTSLSRTRNDDTSITYNLRSEVILAHSKRRRDKR